MYRNKKDVDKHVESLMSTLSVKEFKTRAYSIARLYYEVGDFGSCQKYVEQYLTQKDNNAVAHKLLGQALNKLGFKEKAIEQFKIAIDIDPTRTSLVLDLCELLADDDVSIDVGRAKYWCEKAESNFPKHPVTFALREKLATIGNSDPEAVIKLLTSEIANRPKDTVLHARLLKHYLQSNNIKLAFEHSCNVEFGDNSFINNYAWYETLAEILKHKSLNTNDWLFQLGFLTVREHLCALSLTETPSGSSKSLIESNELLHQYDQSIETVAKAGPTSGYSEFHASLLQHHRGQFAFHAATFILKKAKKDQVSWRDAIRVAAPLMLMAWHSVPMSDNVHWLKQAPQKQKVAVHRWYLEGTFRCSQAGHYILSNINEKYQSFLDQISQYCSGNHWKDKLYEKLFASRDHLSKIKSSHFISTAFSSPILRIPRNSEVEAYDEDAQKYYGNSLHHFVWMLSNYKNYSHFKCTIFDMLTTKSNNNANCGPETLSKLDVYAFLYCAAITSAQDKQDMSFYRSGNEKPPLLPANVTDLLCTLPQMKWWDCAYKFCSNELGSELTDIRATLSRGIEVVRCIDSHGLDCKLLCTLGSTFSELAALSKNVEEKINLENRSALYYKSALPDLEKLKSKIVVKVPKRRLFEFCHNELGYNELNSLIEDAKLNIAIKCLSETEYEKVIELLSSLTSPKAYFHLSETYLKMAFDESNTSKNLLIETKPKRAIMLSKAKAFAYKALDSFKDTDNNKRHPLFSKIQELIESIETHINKLDFDISGVITNDIFNKYSSDENVSSGGSEREHLPNKMNPQVFRNLSSTPKHQNNANFTNYRTANDSHILDNTRVENQFMERIENQIKSLQKKDSTINDFMGQTKEWFDENRILGNQIISTINSNMENTTDQFKLLKISIDQVKVQIDECRNECKDVGDLKKQIAELKKEVNKLKKASSDQCVDENGLYNIEEDYRSADSATSFAAQLPLAAQLMPQFNQRIVPPIPIPNPYQLYSQNLYNMYNQYTQFAQATPVAPAPPIFDTTKTQAHYPGAYPTPEQMYLDVAHLIPPPVPPVPVVPQVSAHSRPSMPSVQSQTPLTSSKLNTKDVTRSLPVNVVITTSDPLPTCTSTPTSVLSVSIPYKHIKGPHNYQITMPATEETKIIPPPVFSFPASTTKGELTNQLSNWNQANIFKNTPSLNLVSGDSICLSNSEEPNASKNVGDGTFGASSCDNSLNKSRTLSERSNTSIENYDPCPDFKPIIPLPAEVKVTTGEENEKVIFRARAKLFRFVDKQWKERGLGEMKLLKHNVSNKVRVLMRREQIHKVCANHIISSEMEIKPMKNEAKAYFWFANDFADEAVVLEKFCIRFKTPETAKLFYDEFEKARLESVNASKFDNTPKTEANTEVKSVELSIANMNSAVEQSNKTVVGGFSFNSTPTFKFPSDTKETSRLEPSTTKVNVFGGFTFKTTTANPFSNLFVSSSNEETTTNTLKTEETSKLNTSDNVEEFEPTVEFKPVVPLPELVETKTGEEEEVILFEHRAKLLRFDSNTKEWKERGLGNVKLLVNKDNAQKVRLLMRREQVMKVCCNHAVTKDLAFQKMPKMDKAVSWCAQDFSEGELTPETFCLRFKNVQVCDDFLNAVKDAQSKLKFESKSANEEQTVAKQSSQVGFGEQFKPKSGSWSCNGCYTNNLETFLKCACCDQPNPQNVPVSTVTPIVKTPLPNWQDLFKPKPHFWECKECLVRNEPDAESCCACNSPKDPSNPKEEVTSIAGPKFSFGIPAQTSASIISKQDTPSTLGITNLPNTTLATKFSFGIPISVAGNVFGQPKISDNLPSNFGLKQSVPEIQTTPSAAVKTYTESNSNTPFGTKDGGSFDFVFKPKTSKGKSPVKTPKNEKGGESDDNEYASEDEGHHIHFSPIIPLPDKVDVVTGEEQEQDLYAHRAKLFVFTSNEWKERGIGIVKILKHKENGKLRVVMRREQVLKICLNHLLTSEVVYTSKDDKTWLFVANDYSEGELVVQRFCLRFKSKDIAEEFKNAVDNARNGKLTQKEDDNRKDDEVVFVGEIQATAQEKQQAKDLMLPENFYTYKNKEPCKGCRGCEVDDNESTVKNIIGDEATTATPVKPQFSLFQSPKPSLYGTPSNSGNKTLNASIFRTPLESINSNNKYSTPSNVSNLDGTITDEKENTLVVTPNNLSTLHEQTSIFSTPHSQTANVFGGLTVTPTSSKSIIAEPKLIASDNVKNENSTAKLLFASAQNSASGGTALKKSDYDFSFGKKTESGLNQELTPISSKSIIAEPKLIASNEVKNENSTAKSLFASAQNSAFGGTALKKSDYDFSFGKKTESGLNQEPKSLFGDTDQKPVNPTVLHNMFSGNSQGGLFGLSALANTEGKSGGSIFGSVAFGSSSNPTFDSKSIFGTTASKNTGSLLGSQPPQTKQDTKTSNELKNGSNDKDSGKYLFSVDNNLSFAALSSSGPGFHQNNANFKWEGTGQQLFTGGQKALNVGKKDTSAEESKDDIGEAVAGADEEYDPHYEPIVPLPDKIVVTTGEEDEKKLFSERCKLYRFDDKAREWKERGIGEIKILFHPERKTYRLLLRREQVHKAVLNMLLFMELELLPMKNSDKAWTWSGWNYAETPTGEQELLAVRFKTPDLAGTFKSKIIECVRKLQAEAAQTIREKKESDIEVFKSVAPLRLPKHLELTSRADNTIATLTQNTQVTDNSNGEVGKDSVKQVHFEEQKTPEVEEAEEYEHEYDQNEDYEGYYNEEEEESGAFFSCEGEAVIVQGETLGSCPSAHIQVMFDQEIYSPKILVTDFTTGEILADMLIHTDTEFQMSGDSCTWSGTDYTTNDPVDKTVTINFEDSDTAFQFHNSVETSKGATFNSTDPDES